MAALVFTEGPRQGFVFELGSSNLVLLGRDASCTVQILDSRLSRHHLQIAWDATSDQHRAIDFNSHNGVYVNGERIGERTTLTEGDVIDIGVSRLVYTREEHPDAEKLHNISKRFGQGHIQTQLDID